MFIKSRFNREIRVSSIYFGSTVQDSIEFLEKLDKILVKAYI